MYTAGAAGDTLGFDIACFERMSETLLDEISQGLVDQVTLVVRDEWNVVEIDRYAFLMKQLGSLPVFTEVYLEGSINLSTFDMFTAGLRQEGIRKARRRFNEEPDALRMSSALKVTMHGVPSDWEPLNEASSFLWSLGDELESTPAEYVFGIYSNPNFCTLDIGMVEAGYLERLGGSDVRMLGRAEKGWAVGSMPLGRDPMVRDNRVAVSA